MAWIHLVTRTRHPLVPAVIPAARAPHPAREQRIRCSRAYVTYESPGDTASYKRAGQQPPRCYPIARATRPRRHPLCHSPTDRRQSRQDRYISPVKLSVAATLANSPSFFASSAGLCAVFGWRIFCERKLPLGMRRVHSSGLRSRPLARSRALSPFQFITAGEKQHVGRGAAGRWHGRVAIWKCHHPVTSLGRGCQKLRFKVGDRSL